MRTVGLMAFGDAGGIEGAFGVDAAGAVLLSGPAPLGHPDSALGGQRLRRWGTWQFTSGKHGAGNSRRLLGRVTYLRPLGEVHTMMPSGRCCRATRAKRS